MAKLFSWGKDRSNESALVQALRQRKESAYAQLYKELWPQVERLVGNRGSEDDAKEALQMAMIRLFEKLDDPIFQLTGTTTVNTYLYSIAKYTWWKINKDRGRYIPYEPDPLYQPREDTDALDDLPPLSNEPGEPSDDPLTGVEGLASIDEILQYIKIMGQPCTDTLLDHYLAQIPLKEMAEEEGISEGTMRVRIHRCREQVKRHFLN